MPEETSPKIPAGDPGHDPRTRSEALRESLKARRTPQPPREFSTLVLRSESPQRATCGVCRQPMSLLPYGPECDCAVWPELAVLAIIALLAGPEVPAGDSTSRGAVVGSGATSGPAAGPGTHPGRPPADEKATSSAGDLSSSRSVRAGATDCGRDVVDDQGEGEPRAATSDEGDHCGGES